MFIKQRMIIGSILLIIGLICFAISNIPLLSKKEQRELDRLDEILNQMKEEL